MSFSILLTPRYFVSATLVALCVSGCGDDDSGDSVPDAGQTEFDASTGDDTTTPAQPDAAADDGPTSEPPEDAGGNTEPTTSEPDGGSTAPTSDEPDAAVPEPDAAAPDVDGGLDSGSASPEDGGDETGADAAPPADAATDAGGGDFEGVEETALLDRQSTEAYACEVSTEARLLEVASGFDATLVGVDDTVWYARGETPFVEGETPSLQLSTLGLDATLGESISLGESEFDSFNNAQIVATPEGLLVFTQQYGQLGMELKVAATSFEGEVSHAAEAIEGIDGTVDNYAVAVGSDDIGLLFSGYTDNGAAMYYATLDFDGTLVGEPRLVRVNQDAINPGAITATSVGYLFSYIMGYSPSQMLVQAVDGAGTLGAAEPVATNANGLSIPHSMLTRGNEVLLAWTDTGGSWDNSDLDRTTILSRVDLDGHRVAQDVRVQSPVTSQERVDPKLVERGDDIGLLWSEGSVIYICAGCMPDNHLQFVLLDGETLAPASDPVTLTNPAVQGGLINPTGWWRGDDLSVVAAVGYHTSGEGAAATINCTEQ